MNHIFIKRLLPVVLLLLLHIKGMAQLPAYSKEQILFFTAQWKGDRFPDVMLMGNNCPIRIGRAAVLAGDLVLGKKEGVLFIPAHLAEKTIITAEFVALKDAFSHMHLLEKKYTPGQIDLAWSEEIKKDFLKWVNDNPSQTPLSKKELDDYLKTAHGKFFRL